MATCSKQTRHGTDLRHWLVISEEVGSYPRTSHLGSNKKILYHSISAGSCMIEFMARSPDRFGAFKIKPAMVTHYYLMLV